MSDPKRVVKLAKQFREVLEVAEDLAKIGDLEQAIRTAEQMVVEAKDHMKIAVGGLRKVREDLVTAEDDLKLVKKEAEDTISLAKQAAQEIVSDAKEEAEVIVKMALESEQVVADRIVIDQERHSADMSEFADSEAEARVAVKVIEEKLTELRAQIGLS